MAHMKFTTLDCLSQTPRPPKLDRVRQRMAFEAATRSKVLFCDAEGICIRVGVELASGWPAFIDDPPTEVVAEGQTVVMDLSLSTARRLVRSFAEVPNAYKAQLVGDALAFLEGY